MPGLENPIDWRKVEDAIQEWFERSTGLGPGKVVWANQDMMQPPHPYATLNVISGPRKIGGEDETRCKIVDGQAKLLKVGEREFTVSCQTHVGPTNDNNPEEHSRALMSRAEAALGLPEYRDRLTEAGVSVIEQLNILNLDLVVADQYISRTGMDVRFGLAVCTSQDIQTIENVIVNGTLSRAEGDPSPIAMDEIGG